MTFPQWIALLVLIGVVGTMVWGKARSDVVALTGAAVLLATRTLRPVEVEQAFASPAIITLASLFVIAYAIELSGLLGLVIRASTQLCRRCGGLGLWAVIGVAGAASAFLNNTPIVVLATPVVRDVAVSLNLSPRRYLIPLSYITVLGGTCTLIGTSTNLLVNDMARNAGQPAFGLFEITPIGLAITLTGAAYLLVFGRRLLSRTGRDGSIAPVAPSATDPRDDPSLYPTGLPLRPVPAMASLGVFVAVVATSALGLIPIAAAAFAGAVLLVVGGAIDVEDAYRGLRPDILFLISGMVIVGLSLQVTGLADVASALLVDFVRPLGPQAALALVYGVTLLLTEFLSNAAVAVLLTPVAVALAGNLGVSPRPFLVAIMMAASAAFATPFGYQTNVLVFKAGGYSYLDFVKVGLPLNLLTWTVAAVAIPLLFPF